MVVDACSNRTAGTSEKAGNGASAPEGEGRVDMTVLGLVVIMDLQNLLIFQKNATTCERRSFTYSPTNSLTLTVPRLQDGLHIWRIFRELKRVFR
jgi:hypothetical protein